MQFGEEQEIFVKVYELADVKKHPHLHVRTGIQTRNKSIVWLQEGDITGQGFLARDPHFNEPYKKGFLIFSSGYLRRTDMSG